MTAPKEVAIFEVGPRDGLQNEKSEVPTAIKLAWVNELIQAGVRDFELGAFVRPDRIPQMADTEILYEAVAQKEIQLGKARAWALVPNLKGLERAIECDVKYVAVFTGATETFVQKNIGMSIQESLDVFKDVIREAKKKKILVRGYLSTAFGCPYEGAVSPKQTLKVAGELLRLGVCQVAISDTIGVANPKSIEAVIKPAIKNFGVKKVSVHLHDTRGTALANSLRALDCGARALESSAGGLGGCPYAPGASGNLATEDLLYMLHGMGVRTGIDLEKLARASLKIFKSIQKPLISKYLQAFIQANKNN